MVKELIRLNLFYIQVILEQFERDEFGLRESFTLNDQRDFFFMIDEKNTFPRIIFRRKFSHDIIVSFSINNNNMKNIIVAYSVKFHEIIDS